MKTTEKYRSPENGITVACVIIIFYALIESIGITCPIRFLTGISCAGCGMSRAWLCVLQFDFRRAFEYHPLFPLPGFFAIGFLFRRRIPEKVKRALCLILVILFMVVYIFRLADGSDSIVVFEPEHGLILRVLHMILKGGLK